MNNHPEPVNGNTTSPFDSIKRTRPDGTEYWSARDLMPLLGYDRWENFAQAIERAHIAAEVQGHYLPDLFRGVTKKGAGRPHQDFELARFACYLVAMNGDPRKAEIASAMAYFAIKTREAETAKSPAELTRREILNMALEAEDRAELEAARADKAELEAKRSAQVIQIQAPMVAKAAAHSEVENAIGRQAFARQVQQFGDTRGANIKQQDVFDLLGRHGMCVRGDRKDRGHITSQARKNGWGWNKHGVSEKNGHEFVKPLIKKKGQDIAWKWVLADFETYGESLNPRKAA